MEPPCRRLRVKLGTTCSPVTPCERRDRPSAAILRRTRGFEIKRFSAAELPVSCAVATARSVLKTAAQMAALLLGTVLSQEQTADFWVGIETPRQPVSSNEIDAKAKARPITQMLAGLRAAPVLWP